LGEGIYEIHAPIRLANNIKITGCCEKTVLHKGSGYASKFTEDADYGELFVTVEDATGFKEGMGIMVYDTHYSCGWDVSTAVIRKVDGNRVYFDNYLIRDYNTDYCGGVSNACSIIEGVDIRNARISNLSIEGNSKNNDMLNGCRGGGIYLHKAGNCMIENVKVRNFNGDGFSWQITEDVVVRKCEVSGCTGYGLHPGSGSVNTLVENCDIRDNGSDGIFVCWRVKDGIFRNNNIYHNGGCGIDIGHKDTDNLFEHNHIYGNNFCGILMRSEKAANGAHRNKYKGNTVENNGGPETGYGIYIDSYVENVTIEENNIRDTGEKVQRIAIMVNEKTKDLKIENNTLYGHQLGEVIYSKC
jgi:hypothetical protein